MKGASSGTETEQNPPYHSGSLRSPDMGCMVDGLPTSCDLANRLIRSGTGVPCHNNDCGPRMINGRLTPFHSSMAEVQSHGLGLYSVTYNWGRNLGVVREEKNPETGEWEEVIGGNSNTMTRLFSRPVFPDMASNTSIIPEPPTD